MLFVISTLLLLVNAVTLSRVRSILFNRVAILILLYSGIICYDSLNTISLDTVIGIYGDLFHSSKTHSFALFLFLIEAILLQLIVYYPRRSQKSMGAMGKEISSFFLTNYTIHILLMSLLGSLLVRSSFDINPVLLCALIPIKIYSNVEADKGKIIQDNKDKSGIYMFKNLINGKRYIGSSFNLNERFRNNFSINYLEYENKRVNSKIYRALLKYDYYNFLFSSPTGEILEYCSPSKCLEREYYYLGILNPEYNISLNPTASFAGHTHSDESLRRYRMLIQVRKILCLEKIIAMKLYKKYRILLKNRSFWSF
jgi:hypothetical protein